MIYKNKIAVLALLILPLVALFAAPAQAVLMKETCINTTHLLSTYEYNLTVDATETLYNFTQISDCTEGCLNNQCVGVATTSDSVGGIAVVAGAAFIAALFCWLGLKFEITTAVEMTPLVKMFELALRAIFMIVGVFFALNTLAIAENIARVSGTTIGVGNLIANQLGNMTRVTYFMVFAIMMTFLGSLIFWYVKIVKSQKRNLNPRNLERYKGGYRGKK